MEASSGVQLDGSTTIEVDEGAGGAGVSYSGSFGNAGSDGALLIVSNTNVIVVCNNDDDDDSVLLIVCFA